MLRHGFDETRGIVIGGDFVSWQLFYDGRPQSTKLSADNPLHAIQLAKEKLEEIRKDCGRAFKLIYPDNKWEVRIWD